MDNSLWGQNIGCIKLNVYSCILNVYTKDLFASISTFVIFLKCMVFLVKSIVSWSFATLLMCGMCENLFYNVFKTVWYLDFDHRSILGLNVVSY